MGKEGGNELAFPIRYNSESEIILPLASMKEDLISASLMNECCESQSVVVLWSVSKKKKIIDKNRFGCIDLICSLEVGNKNRVSHAMFKATALRAIQSLEVERLAECRTGHPRTPRGTNKQNTPGFPGQLTVNSADLSWGFLGQEQKSKSYMN